ncbi:cardiolipin synthase ClsB [Hydrogenophaga sp. 5NK40-0174]|uniref:cardiolipin synthase ClsB n=1 Tax=Hydrogenophaga sp. 5NK40-0174 TaxID=3127649 RepID=UPI0033426366
MPSALGQMQPGHHLTLLQGGGEFFPALVEAMDAARELVHLETYIFEFAGGAIGVAEAMIRAARRGVEVRLVIDGVGSPSVPPEWRARLNAAGVLWTHYAPLGRLGLLIPSRWRRLHRKLCVVDGEVGFCGGINIIDDRDDVALGHLKEPRLDYSLRVTGPLVTDMAAGMEQLWWRMQVVRRIRRREFRAAWGVVQGDGSSPDLKKLFSRKDSEKKSSGIPAAGEGGSWVNSSAAELRAVDDASAALVLRDNVGHRADIEKAYLKAIGEARQSILIANAYFVPGRRLRKALIMARQRGVSVRLLLQGKYENFFQYHAARPVYNSLTLAGIELFEYEPSALHAKVAVVDQRWATVGSTNLDPLSLLLAREANVMTTDPRFAQLLFASLENEIEHASRKLDAKVLAARPWRQRAFDRIAFALMRTLLFLTGHRY